jgi:hypothetical protein
MESKDVKEKENIYEKPVFEKQESPFTKEIINEFNNSKICLRCSGCHGCR